VIEYNLRDPKTEIFIITLDKIDCLIENKFILIEFSIIDNNNINLEKTLSYYHEFADIFFKSRLNKLFLTCLYNHKIQLMEKIKLSYSPIYKISIDKLKILYE
jgi:hypothetical protein